MKKEVVKEGSVGKEEENEWMFGWVLFLEEVVLEDLVFFMYYFGF